MTGWRGGLDPTGDRRAALLAALEYGVSPLIPNDPPRPREEVSHGRLEAHHEA